VSRLPTRVAVIGAGTMGVGIAQATAAAGWPTTLTDTRTAALDGALDRIAKTLDGAVQRGKLDAAGRDAVMGRLRTAPGIRAACEGADLVIEAVIEDLDAKRDVLSQGSDWAEPHALLATNTSSLSIADIARDMPRPERVVGLHFFNPVHVMKLVEIVLHDGSGLAPDDRVSCTTLLDVVRLTTRPRFAAVDRGLPIAAQTGTLLGRFGGGPLAGRLRAKTGTLDNVVGLAGVIDGPNELRFAFLANGAFSTDFGMQLQSEVATAIGSTPDVRAPADLVPPP